MTNREGLTRRQAIIGLGAGLVTGFSGEAQARDKRPSVGEGEQREAYEALLTEIEGQIEAFAQQKTHLERRDINRILEHCNFIDHPLHYETIETTDIEPDLQALLADTDNPNADRDVLQFALDSNHVRVRNQQLVIAQVDFADVGMGKKAEAFYDTEYQTIFVDQQPEHRKADTLSRSIYTGVMTSELNSRTNAVIERMPDQEREAILAEQARVKTEFLAEYSIKARGHLNDIPPELLLRYQNNIRAAVSNTRLDAAMRYVHNVTALTHEAFHHFFETMFTRPGYTGPTQEDALVLTLTGIRDRQATAQASQYAPEFFQRGLLEAAAVDLTDDAAIRAFAHSVSERFDFSHYPAGTADTPDARDCIAVYRLVNEFFARIYSGALGDTDQAFEAMVTDQVKDIPFVQIDPTKRAHDLQYHTPTAAELEFLRKMEWQGKPILD